MKINTYPDYPSLSVATTLLIKESIIKNPESVICIASGSTPIQVFHLLVEACKSKQLDISQCTFVSLDEWIGIPTTSHGSCRNMMDRDFFLPLQIPESKIKFFDGMSTNPQRECDTINDFIASKGGLDVMLVGVGLNGHIAMNEPGTSPDLYAHIGQLAEETIEVGQKYFKEKTKLSQGLTLGIKHFREAKLPILMANGVKKAEVVKRAVTITPNVSCPASIVQSLPHAYVMVDKEAGGLL